MIISNVAQPMSVESASVGSSTSTTDPLAANAPLSYSEITTTSTTAAPLAPAADSASEPSTTTTAVPDHTSTAVASRSGDSRVAAAQRMAQALFIGLNEDRQAHGLSVLAWNGNLTSLSQSWSVHMLGIGALVHRNVNGLLGTGRLAGFNGFGENILKSNDGYSARSLQAAWMNSEEHRANILEPEFNQVGIGVVCGDDGEIYATQDFGRNGTQAAGTLAPTPPANGATAWPDDDPGPSCNG